MSIAFLSMFGSTSVLTSKVSLSVVSLLLLLHIILSLCNNNFNWLGAFGAILTVYALLLSFTNSVYPSFKEDIQPPHIKKRGIWYDYTKKGVPDESPEEYAIKSNQEHKEQIETKYKSLINTYYVSIAGTLLWAYSGFLNALI